mgnify:CR=1 FL=1
MGKEGREGATSFPGLFPMLWVEKALGTRLGKGGVEGRKVGQIAWSLPHWRINVYVDVLIKMYFNNKGALGKSNTIVRFRHGSFLVRVVTMLSHVWCRQKKAGHDV